MDTTGPTVAFSSAPAINTRSESATFRFEPEELIKGSMSCTIDGKAIGCANGRVKLPRVSTGDHTLAVKATDVAGNVGTTSFDWMVDRTRPQVGILDAPNKLSSNPVSAFNLWSNEGPGFFGCSLDGAPAMPCFGAPNFTNLKEGRHTLKVWSVDLAYNESPAITYVWKIDRTPPIVSLGRRSDRRVDLGSGRDHVRRLAEREGPALVLARRGRVHQVLLAGPLRGSVERSPHVPGLRGRRGRQPVGHGRAGVDDRLILRYSRSFVRGSRRTGVRYSGSLRATKNSIAAQMVLERG